MDLVQTIPIVREELAPGIYRSRWGYHPVDYDTYRMIKKLAGYYWKAVSQWKTHRRWERKAPQNRVIRRTIYNSECRATRQKIGTEVVGPLKEPRTSNVFAGTKFIDNPHPMGHPYKREVLEDCAVLGALRACYPVPGPEGVSAIPPSLVEVFREMLARCEAPQ